MRFRHTGRSRCILRRYGDGRVPAGASQPGAAGRLTMRSPGRAVELIDRTDERAALDRLVGEVRAGQSPVLVLRGEPGVGKSVLLDYVSRQAAGCRIVRV